MQLYVQLPYDHNGPQQVRLDTYNKKKFKAEKTKVNCLNIISRFYSS